MIQSLVLDLRCRCRCSLLVLSITTCRQHVMCAQAVCAVALSRRPPPPAGTGTCFEKRGTTASRLCETRRRLGTCAAFAAACSCALLNQR